MSSVADLEKRIELLEREVEENHNLIQQIKGAGFFLKLCFIAAPTLGVAVVWAKNHIHF
jgi:hypothetical protein